MAHLHVKTPGGTAYSIDLDVVTNITNQSGGSKPTGTDVNRKGWLYLPNGCIIQFGGKQAGNVTFPISFNTDIYSVTTANFGTWYPGADAPMCYLQHSNPTITGFTTFDGGEFSLVYWMAIGS